MPPGVATKITAVCCGICGFVVAIVAGLFVENPAETILIRAIIALLACQAVGYVIGAIAEKTIETALAEYKTSRPIPEVARQPDDVLEV